MSGSQPGASWWNLVATPSDCTRCRRCQLEGLDLKDLLRDHPLLPHDISLSRHLVALGCCWLVWWMSAVTRLRASAPPSRGRSWAFEGGWRRTVRTAGLDWSAVFQSESAAHPAAAARSLSDQWLAGLKLRNTDDELLISKAFYGVLDEAAVRESLHLQKELSVSRSGSQYSWLAKAKGRSPTS